jgi:hypothetical protein
MLRWLRKPLILLHRYLGMVLSLLFLMWFVSGIGMIYARGMPGLTPALRLERMPELDLAAVNLSPGEAAAKAGLESPSRALLLTVMERPAYRFFPDPSSAGSVTVFADSGDVFDEIGARQAVEVAERFMALPAERLQYASRLTHADQWTIPQRGQVPLHKIVVEDEAATELYVAAHTGEVVVHTTRGSRALAWVAAIPHWLYFAPLRIRTQLWSQVVIWVSIAACISVILGLVLAVIQLRRTRPRIPYSGWMRWHYITGAVFGVFTLTWVFSGLLSMEPWEWAKPGEGLGAGMRESLSGGPLDVGAFAKPGTDWAGLLPGKQIKEAEFLRIQGAPFVLARVSASERHLIAIDPLRLRTEPFSAASLLERLMAPNPEAGVVESALLAGYDSYYYAFDGQAPLPVLRVKFDDPYQTWFYVDPKMGQIVARYHRLGRVERWIYRGFHSLDFSFWYYNRPVWDIGVIGLSLGGAALSGIGVVISCRRILRFFRSLRRRG